MVADIFALLLANTRSWIVACVGKLMCSHEDGTDVAFFNA